MKAYYPIHTDEVLHNPGMGWVMQYSAIEGSRDANELISYDKIDHVAILSTWFELEPEMGRYHWQSLDRAIEKWIGEGKKLNFRISTEPLPFAGKGHGAPEWLFKELGVEYQVGSENGIRVVFPDYLNRTYQQRLRAFLSELVNRYGDLPELETVDLRGYGVWGEWHSGYQYPDYAKRSQALREIIDIWHQAWSGKKQLLLSCSYEWREDMVPRVSAPKSYEEYLYWSAFDYALTKPGISFRRDGIGGALKIWDSTLMENYFKSGRLGPLTTEFFYCYNVGKEHIDGIRGYHCEDALEEALMLHPNYMMLMWDSNDFYRERQDLIDHALRHMGYRLMPRCVDISDNVRPGSFTTIRHSWTNLAVGRLLTKCKLSISVCSDQGNIVANTIDCGIDLRNLISGTDKTFYSNLFVPAGLQPGEYSIRFCLVGEDGNDCIRMPLEDADSSGSYAVAKLMIKQAGK